MSSVYIQRSSTQHTRNIVALLIGNGSARSVHSVVGAGNQVSLLHVLKQVSLSKRSSRRFNGVLRLPWSTSRSDPGRPIVVANSARKGMLSSIDRTPPAVASLPLCQLTGGPSSGGRRTLGSSSPRPTGWCRTSLAAKLTPFQPSAPQCHGVGSTLDTNAFTMSFSAIHLAIQG